MAAVPVADLATSWLTPAGPMGDRWPAPSGACAPVSAIMTELRDVVLP
jgi:hypothetical protein